MFLAVIICFAVGSIDPAASRAEKANGETRGRPSNEITCAGRGHSHGAKSAIAAGSHRPYADSKDRNAASGIPVWKTITLGTYKSANALRDALKAARCGIGDLAGGALDWPAFTVTKTETPVDLIVLSAAELVSEAKSVSLAEIYSRATQLGLELCHAEIAPRLRLQYQDQPAGELLHVAMEPIPTDRGPVAFTLGNGGAGLFLIGGDGRADRMVSSTARFVFVRPRPAAGLRS
jgi:hypothetical protein